jgi:hypothetical protein
MFTPPSLLEDNTPSRVRTELTFKLQLKEDIPTDLDHDECVEALFETQLRNMDEFKMK